ncbi:MAG: hypothetical protein A3H60_01710 [Candidatus Zambryskibacteria bacterium RIFCSPLOWO2_02_FULL_44_12b]|uniref:Uncharacterized protein n=1 Tax=Candidatus Zambryskibacteria bacterium RIFCSPLOWO2_02_FULL_44_12b TaxID=1802772 RepID=A0A1G2UMM1_9BACT|nr:MAG: hypothetical protein A3H60_01710 [Candidatus Zambryskibacteria bacterium RIFCSPLOWO2_02_FULL_44_12b]
MKKYFSHILILVITVEFFAYPHYAHAVPWLGFWSGIADLASDVFLAPFGWLAILILQIATLLTYLSGTILNFVVQYTVLDFADKIKEISGINIAWRTIRDLANMGFIFILLYAAIKTILGVGGETQKLIRNIVIVAVLINFSLFFTKIVIDISNVLAIFFYDAIAPGALQNTVTTGLSGTLMNPLKLTSLWDVSDIAFQGKTLIIVGIMGTIVSLIVAFVFFAISIMFVIRFVVLIFTLILSPLAFMGFILPQLEKQKNQWWEALSGQAFFAPIYFMLTWVVIKISSGLIVNQSGTMVEVFTGTLGANGGVTQPSLGSMGILVNFIIMIVLIIASLLIAKEWANKAGPSASAATKWAMGAAGGASFGLAGRAGRYTVGAAAEMAKESKIYKRLEAASPNSRLARLTLAATDKTSRASFDARGGRLGGVLAGAGIEGGKAQEGGFEADRKAYREFMEKPGTESHKKRQERARGAQNELDVMAGVTAGATPAQIAAMETALAKMSDKEVEAIVSSNRKLLDIQVFANSISVKQLEALNKSDKFSEAEKDNLKNGPRGVGGRFSAINAGTAAMAVPVAARTPAQVAAVAALPGATRNLSDAELEMINAAHLGNSGFVSGLRGAQIDGINKSYKFTTSQKAALRGARQQPLLNALTTVPASIPAIQTAARGLNAKEMIGLMRVVGRGGVNAAVDPAVLPIYTPKLLQRMALEMDTADIPTLRAAIIAGGNPGTIAWLTNPATAGEFA